MNDPALQSLLAGYSVDERSHSEIEWCYPQMDTKIAVGILATGSRNRQDTDTYLRGN